MKFDVELWWESYASAEAAGYPDATWDDDSEMYYAVVSHIADECKMEQEEDDDEFWS